MNRRFARVGGALAGVLLFFTTTHAHGEDTTPLRERPPVSLHFRLAPLLSYVSFNGGAALMSLPVGASLDLGNIPSGPGNVWFSYHASIFGPGVNWTGIKNPKPFYPSVLGAASTGVRLSLAYRQYDDEDDKDFCENEEDKQECLTERWRRRASRGILSLDLSLLGVVTGELLVDPMRCDTKGPVSAGVGLGLTWIP